MAINPPSPRPLSELLKLRESFHGSTDADHREWIETNGITAEELGMLANATKSKRNETGKPLPLFPLEMFAVPTEIPRTALFKTRRRGPRKPIMWEQIDSRKDIKIEYFGVELDNHLDLDLWLLVISIARGQTAGSRIPITLTGLLRELGRSTGGKSRNNVKLALDRLASATLRVEIKRKDENFQFTTSLMNWGIDKKRERMFVRVDPDGYMLFENLSYLNFETHLQLEGGVTKALHLYAISHKRGKKHSQPLEKLKKWFGYDGRTLDFRRAMIDGMRQLEETGVICEGKIYRHQEEELASWILNKK